MNRQKIAIVGSGISGLTSAYLLHEKHDITVFEANDYIGGHTHTIPVSNADGELAVDTGFIVCNDRNYPNFLKFMSKLGVKLLPSEMSFSVKNPSLGLEYNGHNLNTLFSQRRNLLNPRFLGFVRNILKFNELAKLEHQRGAADISLQAFLNQHKFDSYFSDNYLLPMVGAIWSCSVNQAGHFPLRFFLRFFLNHGLLDVRNRPQWFVVEGGSSAYIEPMTKGFAKRIILSTPIKKIERRESSILVFNDRGKEEFDQIILACHSDQALALLAEPSALESTILQDLAYQENDVVLHQDSSLMPISKRAWASWNFLAGDRDAAPMVTYYMNRLQHLPNRQHYFVTLNASEKIDDDKVIGRYHYAHPVYSQASQAAQQRRSEICGKDRIHFCGAYWYNGFHEDGVRSALDVAARFGGAL